MSRLFPLVVTAAEARRRGQRLVGPLDLRLKEEVGATVVLGPNGSGKTTLLQLLHGTVRLHAGSIRWQTDQEAARAAQAFVFQRPVMLRRSVLENLIFPLRVRGTPRTDAAKKARDWAMRVGLGDVLDRSAPALSGGEQQKLALARALITGPQLVFLDEPCAALDGRAMREIEALLAETKAAGTRLILSTHDMGQARRLADDVVFLRGGKVHETGPAADFFTAPKTPEARAFLKGDIVE
ncbi:MAG: ATP-binding cassette domain-containing protein [Pseudomonadota bacterium]